MGLLKQRLDNRGTINRPGKGKRLAVEVVEIVLHENQNDAKKLLGFKHLLLFVLAYFFYNDATQTVIAVSGAYAEDTLNYAALVGRE